MILVAGSANLDFVVRAPHIPAPGETVLGHNFKTYPGGKGANQAVACARAGGARTHMLLALGLDAFAEPLEASLKAAAVETHVVRVPDLPTGTAFICVSDDAENAITVAPGANLSLRAEHLPALDSFTHLLMQLESPLDTVMAYARAAKAHGVQVVLNAAPAQPLPHALMAMLDILIVNEGELSVLAGQSGSVTSNLARLTVPCVVVTLGHRGACARSNGTLTFQTAFDVTPVDSTGAGDTFCGVLVAALSQGQGLPQAMSLASAAGALACTRAGAQSSIPEQSEVAGFLATQPRAAADALARLRTYCGFDKA